MSVSSWRTSDSDIARALEAFRSAATRTPHDQAVMPPSTTTTAPFT
jgi:hypothetical protein